METLLTLVVGGLVGWLIASHFHKRGSETLGEQLDRKQNKQDWKSTFQYFEHMVSYSTWRKEIIGQIDSWICNSDDSLRIEEDHEFEDFREDWTQCYPDKNSKRCSVFLKRNGEILKELYFIHLDGHRIVVPMPKVISVPQPHDAPPQIMYFWDKHSIDFKVGKIIGDYYIHDDIDGIAKISGVAIVSNRSHI